MYGLDLNTTHRRYDTKTHALLTFPKIWFHYVIIKNEFSPIQFQTNKTAYTDTYMNKSEKIGKKKFIASIHRTTN